MQDMWKDVTLDVWRKANYNYTIRNLTLTGVTYLSLPLSLFLLANVCTLNTRLRGVRKTFLLLKLEGQRKNQMLWEQVFVEPDEWILYVYLF